MVHVQCPQWSLHSLSVLHASSVAKPQHLAHRSLPTGVQGAAKKDCLFKSASFLCNGNVPEEVRAAASSLTERRLVLKRKKNDEEEKRNAGVEDGHGSER